jgi:hypothetical protein
MFVLSFNRIPCIACRDSLPRANPSPRFQYHLQLVGIFMIVAGNVLFLPTEHWNYDYELVNFSVIRAFFTKFCRLTETFYSVHTVNPFPNGFIYSKLHCITKKDPNMNLDLISHAFGFIPNVKKTFHKKFAWIPLNKKILKI